MEQRPEPGARADVCVVGAGAAGIALAVELLRKGKRVTLLEGGGATIEEESQDSYRSEVVGLPHAGVHLGRFRAKGGTTNRWGGQILEYDDRDFERRSWVPGSGWPIGRAELKRHYKRALELEGMAGVLENDEDVWRAVGEATPNFADLEGYFTRWTPEPNFAVVHRAALEENSALTLWLHANAVELVMDGERVAGVRCRTLSGVEAVFEADEYVFCLGTIESSRFFLQPRAGGLPWNRSGLLGKNYQDHIDSNAATIVPHSAERFHALFDNVFYGGFKYHPKLKLAGEVQARLETLNVGATMIFESSADETLGRIKTTVKHLLRGRVKELKVAEMASMVGNLPLLAKTTWRYGVGHRAYNPADATIRLRVHCEQEPVNGSSISLGTERDGLGLLRTRMDWRISDVELRTVRTYAEVARRSLAGLAEVVVDADLMAGSREYVGRCDDSYHQMGGMRMAAGATDGVVDENLRLHGTKNAYVCSCAVFPTSGYSNPTHTLLALAMRLAEHLGARAGREIG
jgi:choline dehydrogenase-like flavoprotein